MIGAIVNRWRHNHRVQQFALLLLAVVFSIFLGQAFHKANRPIGNDIGIFLAVANATWNGEDPYRIDTWVAFTYPPLITVLAIPLTFLPDHLVHFLWFTASVAALVAGTAVVTELSQNATGIRWSRAAILPLTISFLLLLGPIQNHLLNGQTGVFILLLSLFFWRDMLAGRQIRASFWLGVGIAIKLVPGVFLLLLLLERRFRMIAWSTGFAVALNVALPGIFLGSGLPGVLWSFIDCVLLSELHTSALADLHPLFFTPHGFIAWLVPSLKTSLTAKLVCAGLVVAPIVMLHLDLLWRNRSAVHGTLKNNVWLLNVYLMAILLLSPMSETHHLIFCLPIVVASVLKLTADKRWQSGWHAALFGAAVIAIYVGKAVPGPLQFFAIASFFLAAVKLARGVRPSSSPLTAEVLLEPELVA